MLKDKLIFSLKLIVTCSLLVIIANKIELKDLRNSLIQIPISTILCIVLLAVLQGLISSLRWYKMQKSNLLSLKYLTAVKLTWIGTFFAIFLPGGILVGDVIKGYYIKNYGADLKKVAKVIMTEKIYILLMLLVLCIPYVFIYISPKYGILALIAVGLAFLVARATTSYKIYTISFLTIITNLISCVNFYLLIKALHPEMQFIATFIVVPVIILLTSLPISLGGWGVREFAAITLLNNIYVSSNEAVAVSLGLVFASTICYLPGLYLWLKEKPSSTRDKPIGKCYAS